MEANPLKPDEQIANLFHKAKEVDEFEYCSTLLRIRGIEGPGWDPLQESERLAHQIASISQAPIESAFRLRLSLFLYCHLTEMSDVYNITGNMLMVIAGDRYSMAPFIKELHPSNKAARYPTEKSARIKEWADAVGLHGIGAIFDSMLVKEVRNAFYHSDYALSEDSFNIKHGRGVNIDNVITKKVPYEWLFPKMELGINTALAVLNTTIDHIRSYRKDKIVKGRLAADGSYIDMQLTTHEAYGLTGFKSPPDEALYGGN